MQTNPSSTNGVKHDTDFSNGNGKGHIWEVRHAGLLGIMYEVAVRVDLVQHEDEGREILKGVVDAATLGCVFVLVGTLIRGTLTDFPHSLSDGDDDVRSVAAKCLLPVAAHLVESLSEEVGRVINVLWACLRDMKDDLGSSVGVVMDLLGGF